MIHTILWENKNRCTHSNKALKASGWTSKIGIGSFLSAIPPKNIASNTGDAMARISLCPGTTTWFGSEPTRNVQSDHCPDWRRWDPRCFISVQPSCQSLGAPAMVLYSLTARSPVRKGITSSHYKDIFDEKHKQNNYEQNDVTSFQERQVKCHFWQCGCRS